MLEEEPSVLLSVTDFGKILSSNPKKKLQNKRKRSPGFKRSGFFYVWEFRENYCAT